jgi:hypothetical protein
MRKLLATLLFTVSAVIGCSMEDPVVAETRAKLVGTWLEESESGGVSVRRVLSLKADGKFLDESILSTSGSSPERRELAGEWSYDGLNLKRRYLQENGRQFSGGGIRYATFPLKAVTESEIVLEDNIQKRQAKYRRIEKGRGG